MYRILTIVLFLSATVVQADEIVLEGGVAAKGLTLMIGDEKQWDTVVRMDAISSASGYLTAEPDADTGAVRTTWNGKGEAQLFLAYDAPQDYSEHLQQDAALVVLMQVMSPPKRKTVIKMGCGYPCMANANISKLLTALPAEQWLRVSFDLKCFADGGLNIDNVDTPLLLTTAGKMTVSIADVTIVPGVGPEATIHCR
jgi:beta-glucosidase